jgi:hypothetical protein
VLAHIAAFLEDVEQNTRGKARVKAVAWAELGLNLARRESEDDS